MAADPLSDLLKTVRLTGAVFFEIAAEGPWAVASPARELMLPRILPGADHLIAYHVVTAGQCFGTAAGGEPVALKAGDVIVFSNAQAHIMSSSRGMQADPPVRDVLEVAAAGQQPFCINYGNGQHSTRLVCGYLACDAAPFNPLLDNLPPVLTASGDGDGKGWISQFINLAVAETSTKHAGSETVLTRLSEVMFINVVRDYLQRLPREKTGWLAGLRDPFVGKALGMLHDRPAFAWTIDDLAKQTGLSRSVLAERFTELLGIPPMHYLAKWRMQIACEMLTGSNANMANIAARVGYVSEAAFSRAFKKLVGQTPSAWRQRAGQSA
jgi:AraC-like DNA-binding protein